MQLAEVFSFLPSHCENGLISAKHTPINRVKLLNLRSKMIGAIMVAVSPLAHNGWISN
jgi:hypothetical protein